MSDNKPLALFVDDSVSAARIAQKNLAEICDLEVAVDVPEAMELLTKHTYNLILVDYLLPSSSGIELIRILRGMDIYDNIPIIFISSALTNQVAFAAMRAGANASLSKVTTSAKVREEVIEQLAHPHTHIICPEVLETCCLAWRCENVFYQYSPELGETVSSATEQGVNEKMDFLLKEAFQKTKHIKLMSDDIHIKRHLIVNR